LIEDFTTPPNELNMGYSKGSIMHIFLLTLLLSIEGIIRLFQLSCSCSTNELIKSREEDRFKILAGCLWQQLEE